MKTNKSLVLTVLVALLATFGRPASAAVAGASTDLAVLVVSATTNDAALPAIRQALDFLGTPYTVHVASAQPGTLTADRLASGTRGFYSSVMLTDAALAYSPDGTTWTSALSPAEWAALNQYEVDFAVRRLNWSGYPNPDTGFNWPTAAYDSTGNAAVGTWSAAARASFPYLVTSNAFAVSNVWTYLATPLDTNTTVWLADAQGHALIAVQKLGGREVLSLTFDNAPWLIHSTVLAHGLVTWANKGLFLGERHTYLSAQVDDVFLADEMWPGGEFRQSAKDWQATINWQAKFNTRTLGRNFRYDMAFNGLGTVAGEYENDDLTPFVKQSGKSMFKWISHTFTHTNLNTVDYATALSEITKNNQTAGNLGLPNYSRMNMVTPQISGLQNPQFIKAAYDAGIRYLVSDTSIPSHRAASPNTGLPNWVEPRILMIPRHANNLFYNVSTPAEWVSEYNYIYNGYWGRDLSYAEILDNQADLLLGFLLKGDISPLMFHQPNLRDYNGQGNTLLGDLLDAVANKYERLYNFPALSPTMNNLATTLQQRMNYNASGVVATRHADNTLTLTVTKAARIPVTGLVSGGVVSFTGVKPTISSETYAGQRITYVTLAAGASATLKLK